MRKFTRKERKYMKEVSERLKNLADATVSHLLYKHKKSLPQWMKELKKEINVASE